MPINGQPFQAARQAAVADAGPQLDQQLRPAPQGPPQGPPPGPPMPQTMDQLGAPPAPPQQTAPTMGEIGALQQQFQQMYESLLPPPPTLSGNQLAGLYAVALVHPELAMQFVQAHNAQMADWNARRGAARAKSLEHAIAMGDAKNQAELANYNLQRTAYGQTMDAMQTRHRMEMDAARQGLMQERLSLARHISERTGGGGGGTGGGMPGPGMPGPAAPNTDDPRDVVIQPQDPYSLVPSSVNVSAKGKRSQSFKVVSNLPSPQQAQRDAIQLQASSGGIIKANDAYRALSAAKTMEEYMDVIGRLGGTGGPAPGAAPTIGDLAPSDMVQ